MNYVGTAALVAASTGALFAGLVGAVALANLRLDDPHSLDGRGAAVVAGGGLLSGLLFAPLGAELVGTRASLPFLPALALVLGATLLLAVVGGALLQPLAYRYLRWARTPAVLREERDEGY